VLASKILSPTGAAAAEITTGDFSFVQISDSHIGFHKPANPDVAATFRETIARALEMPKDAVRVIYASAMSAEAQEYLQKSGAQKLATPLKRLRKMNPGAITLYREHGIDLESQALEIAVCAQHNNGGLAGNLWWESTTISHLFPIGEVNGSHGVYRPGGASLNAGDTGASGRW